MDPFGLYEDLSLFNGDLLLPAVDEEPLLLPQDGLVTKAPETEAPKSTAVRNALEFPQNGSGELGLVDLLGSSPTNGLPDPTSPTSAWMDTNTDLFSMLTEDVPIQPAEAVPMDSVVIFQAPSPQQQVPASPEPSHLLPTYPLVASPDVDAESLALLETIIMKGVSPAAEDTQQVLATPITLAASDQGVMDNILQDLNDSGLAELIESSDLDASLAEGAVLSPVSYNDVESLLSSGPASPEPVSLPESLNVSVDSAIVSDTSDIALFDLQYGVGCVAEPKSPSPAVRGRAPKRAAPYEKTARRAHPDRKERKKEQNRSAALRYRQKKRDEKGGDEAECQHLEARNKELREKVDSMTREINYLKDLMADVIKAKRKGRGK